MPTADTPSPIAAAITSSDRAQHSVGQQLNHSASSASGSAASSDRPNATVSSRGSAW